MTTLRPVSLDDKYDLSQERIFVTGYQAIIRLCLMQQRDCGLQALHRAVDAIRRENGCRLLQGWGHVCGIGLHEALRS